MESSLQHSPTISHPGDYSHKELTYCTRLRLINGVDPHVVEIGGICGCPTAQKIGQNETAASIFAPRQIRIESSASAS